MFCAVEPKSGRHFTPRRRDRSAFQFAQAVAEIEIGILARQCLGTRRIPDLKTSRREVREWNRRVNRARIRIEWRFNSIAGKHAASSDLSGGHGTSCRR